MDDKKKRWQKSRITLEVKYTGSDRNWGNVPVTPMNPMVTAAILGNWAKVADMVADSFELPPNGCFEWTLNLDGGRDNWEPEDHEGFKPIGVATVDVWEYSGKDTKIRSSDYNLFFLEDGAYPKGYHNPVSIEEMAKAIIAHLVENVEMWKVKNGEKKYQ
ncbi:MAG: hypothetical protein V4674_01840 [Patescibacteria group bacterium]